MDYVQFQPDPRLSPYVDAYWTVKTGSRTQTVSERILPDGCVDLIFNLGSQVSIPGKKMFLESDKLYLVGTMKHYSSPVLYSDTHLLGIRFRPAGFLSFFNFSLHEVVNEIAEFSQSFPYGVDKPGAGVAAVLDSFLFSRLSRPAPDLHPILEDIYQTQGNLDIGKLAHKHFLSIRKLQRLFKKFTGIDPKAFANIVRFRSALNRIKHRDLNTSLLDIAFECGYYDHSHLTKEIRKYTGQSPSQF